jgi:hypothetical protein
VEILYFLSTRYAMISGWQLVDRTSTYSAYTYVYIYIYIYNYINYIYISGIFPFVVVVVKFPCSL